MAEKVLIWRLGHAQKIVKSEWAFEACKKESAYCTGK
jgi:hypothetical protein